MKSSFLKFLRYVVFGLFISCNAIVASLAVWNHSLALTDDWKAQIDIYLAFVGCLGLVHIFTIIFIELTYRHGITGRVWFECLWFGIFWLMYFAGASAATAILPHNLCEFEIRTIVNDACTSSHVLLAFTWIITVILLFYFSLLFIASLLHLSHDSQIFHCYVHKFPWDEIRRPAAKTPLPPPLPHFLKKMPSIIAPTPRRPPPVAIFNNRAGLGSKYEIESYATPQPSEAPLPTFTPPPELLSMMHKPLDPYDETYEPPPQSYAPTSFYPQQVQAAITPSITPQPMLNKTEPRVARGPSQKQFRTHRAAPAEPSPLGDWPRRSILSSSSGKVQRKPPPPIDTSPEPVFHNTRPLPPILSTTAPSPTPSVSPPPPVATGLAAPQTAAATSRNLSSPPRARPSGPRRRSDGEARLAVPELSLTTSHQPSR